MLDLVDYHDVRLSWLPSYSDASASFGKLGREKHETIL